MWSQLKRCFLRAPANPGESYRLLDAELDFTRDDAGGYPFVRRLFFRRSLTEIVALSHEHLQSVDERAHAVHVDSFETAEPVTVEHLDAAVLVDRDVLDALILDIPRRNSLRANDLLFEALESEGASELILKAADVGPWAILRRLARGMLGSDSHCSLVDWRDADFLRGDPLAPGEPGEHRRVAALQPAEIADLLSSMPYLHAAELVTLLPDDVAADTLEVMQPERQVQVFEELQADQQLRLVELMAPDNATDLLARLGPREAQAVLDALQPRRRAALIDLLRYPEQTAGGIMTNDVIVVRADLTVSEARHALRDEIARPDFVYYVYVVDDMPSRHLRGVITLRDLLLADDDQPLTEVMRAALVGLDPLMPADAAARRVAEQHLAALPVVSADGRVLGAVTSDAALRTITPAALAVGIPRIFS